MGATWWRSLSQSEVPMHLRAKNLCIELGEDYIHKVPALEALLREPYADYTFPNVRSLSFKFNLTRESEHSSDGVTIHPDIEAHILASVRRIKQIVPMVQRVYMRSTRNVAVETHFPSQQVNSLVAKIRQSVGDIEFGYLSRPIHVEPSLSAVRCLTRMDGEGGSIESMVQLARHNAPTLQYLDLNLLEGDDITGLIQNADGSYVQYPWLHTLELGTMPNMDLSRRPVFPGALPFPCLRYLRLVLVSPIGDDTPFRGNAATLEYLDLYLTLDMATVLKRSKTFTSISHPKLQYVRLRWNSGTSELRPAIDRAYMQFGLSIGPNAPVREFHMPLLLPGFGSIITTPGGHKRIQVLELPHTSMHILDTIALVKALPLLSHLHSRALPTKPLPNDIPKHNLPAYIIANYSPMGKWLRCWRINCSPNFDFEITAKWALLLALICRNLDYVAVLADSRELFMAFMKKMIASNGYRQHATRLQRLLFGGWNNAIPSVDMALAKKAAARAAVANW
ncbi:hypothetical protein GGI19_004854 [Coemansia pectinata]|uniref:Uncharacterized protein n=1 Tax=Coemansia pectinata TaxID=1052879 RepID=A0A9W8GXI2_9FUNG|nr:hypothetical protein GGI19_004854 [Coemansia pectinata]